jgi:hypothetical protein
MGGISGSVRCDQGALRNFFPYELLGAKLSLNKPLQLSNQKRNLPVVVAKTQQAYPFVEKV